MNRLAPLAAATTGTAGRQAWKLHLDHAKVEAVTPAGIFALDERLNM
jgi:hypothetical protein